MGFTYKAEKIMVAALTVCLFAMMTTTYAQRYHWHCTIGITLLVTEERPVA